VYAIQLKANETFLIRKKIKRRPYENFGQTMENGVGIVKM